jgi:hypothetical protein
MSPRAALVGWAKNSDPASDAATHASAQTLAAWVATSRANGDGGKNRGSAVTSGDRSRTPHPSRSLPRTIGA